MSSFRHEQYPEDSGLTDTAEIGSTLETTVPRTLLRVEPVAHAGSLAHISPEATEGLTDETVAQPADRSHEIFRLSRDSKTYEVTVESDFGAEAYREVTHPDDWAFLEEEAEPLRGTKWAFINPTMEGGGVAMIRPTLAKLMQEFDMDVRWYVMPGAKDESAVNPFLITKQIHNLQQRQTNERLTEAGKDRHWEWADEENGPVLESQQHIVEADFIVIDDPQPAPLIARLKRANPNAKFIWRNHIDTDGDLMADPTTPQGEVASYLLDECGVRDVDAIVTHPVEKFMFRGMEDKTFFAPATIDPFDNLNRHLSPEEQVEGLEWINTEIRSENEELAAAGRFADIQSELSLDPDTKRLTMIARFDPAKRADLAMDMGVRVKRKMRAMGVELDEIVITGNGSKDDPDGEPMYVQALHIRREQYPEEMEGIIVARLPHNYDAMNAVMSTSDVVMQMSDTEGMETRISDAIMHDKPVVISNKGGMKTQVIEGESGIILDYDRPDYDLERGAEFVAKLMTDPATYEAMVRSTRRAAAALNRREFTTTANATRFMRIANHLREHPGEPVDKVWKISDMVAERARAAEQDSDEQLMAA